jgi:hypothetical protein
MNIKKILPIIIVVAIVVAVGTFYGGIKYAQHKTSKNLVQGNFQGFQNMTPEERQQQMGQMGGNNNANTARFAGGVMNRGGGFVSGEIIAKDEQSVTVKLLDGGSKIIFYGDSTEVGKFVTGTATDLEVGKTVTVTGDTNQDGSITAKSIQLRPVLNTTTSTAVSS